MNFKRKRPKGSRSRATFNKPWKAREISTECEIGESFSNHRRRKAADEELKSVRKKKKTTR